MPFFLTHFDDLGLNRLICTSYGPGYVLDIAEAAFSSRASDDEIYRFLHSSVKRLKGDGDFRSDECVEYLKQADIVASNPPFSKFRQYIAQLMKYDKQFLILGNMNAITYKEFFPLLKDGKVWLGCSSGSKEYMTTEEYAKKNPNKAYQRGGKWYTKLGNT